MSPARDRADHVTHGFVNRMDGVVGRDRHVEEAAEGRLSRKCRGRVDGGGVVGGSKQEAPQ